MLLVPTMLVALLDQLKASGASNGIEMSVKVVEQYELMSLRTLILLNLYKKTI
jgi:hypothetical protein